MFVSEIFHSIQGEGQLVGLPSIFIRFSGCNLRCAWCDTPYASWNPTGTQMTEEEILTTISRFSSRHCVLTGGEPMVAREIHHFCQALRERDYHITIETAGTILPAGIPCDLASLSPKLANSTPDRSRIAPGWIERHEQRRRDLAPIRSWLSSYEYQLKFVVSQPSDLDEIEGFLSEVGPVPPERVLLMPEGTTSEQLHSRGTWLTDLCREKGFRFCDRLHIHLFGNTAGT